MNLQKKGKITMKFDSLKVNLQYFLPKHLITRFVGLLAAAKLGVLTTAFIRLFIRAYDINTDEIETEIADFKTFNDFFSRTLKKGARPIADGDDTLIFPADGKISQFGDLVGDFQLQAKNHYFTTSALLADEKDAAHFKNGKFITVYLSPQDYHRVHIPTKGKLLKMTHIPGELFSVNPLYTAQIPELFSRNERAVCIFDTDFGKMALVFVGAAIVRSIETVWEGVVAPSKSSAINTKSYTDKEIVFDKGAEIGKFMMGSTVICLFEKNQIEFADKLINEQKTRVGQKMAVGIEKQKTPTKKSTERTAITAKK